MRSFISPAVLDRWLFEEFRLNAKSLSVYRIVFSVYLILFFNRGSMRSLGALPDVFYHPPYGPMLLFDGFPSPAVFSVVTVGVYLGAFALLLGYRTMWASLLTGFSLMVGYGFLYSLGKINHNMLLILVPLVMAWSRWGAHYSADRLLDRAPEETEVDGWPVAVMALCVGVALFIAGVAKALGGWLDPSLQAVQTHVVRNFYLNDRQALLASTFVNLDWPILWEVADWATVALEIGLLFCVASVSAFRGGLALLVFFHLGVLLTMNISFQHQLFVYALFVEWETLFSPGGVPIVGEGIREAAEDWHFLSLVVMLTVGYYHLESPVSVLNRIVPLETGVSPTTLILMLGAAIFTGGMVVRRIVFQQQ